MEQSGKPNHRKQIRLLVRGRTCAEQSKDWMATIMTLFCLLAAACLFAAERFGALKWVVLLCAMLNLTGCLSFTTTEREHPVAVPVSTVTRTETVYVTE